MVMRKAQRGDVIFPETHRRVTAERELAWARSYSKCGLVDAFTDNSNQPPGSVRVLGVFLASRNIWSF